MVLDPGPLSFARVIDGTEAVICGEVDCLDAVGWNMQVPDDVLPCRFRVRNHVRGPARGERDQPCVPPTQCAATVGG